ncbi:hypothetical protein [Asticcacaulis sp. W401b]|uniref:hypothetical protein n=1 Tax=Asticcacaulis sp. W401b TaxID=3388666 RepID=UPI003970C70C
MTLAILRDGGRSSITIPKAELVFFADPQYQVAVARPIGRLEAPTFLRDLYKAYTQSPALWTYHRLMDLRRFTGVLEDGGVCIMSNMAAPLSALPADCNAVPYLSSVICSFFALYCVVVAASEFSGDVCRDRIWH